MKIKFLSLPVIMVLITGISSAQKVRNLNDCIGTGLERNFSIHITRNNQEVTKNNYSPGNAGFLPTVDLSGRQTSYISNNVQKNADGTQSTGSGQYSASTSAGLSLGLTIFNGFNVQTTYKKLGELKLIGELNTQMTIENFVSDVISGYYNYIQQVQLLNNLRYAVTLSKERLRIDEERYLLGSSSKLQVLQSRVYLNADSTNLSQQNEVVKATMVKLNELMAIDDLGEVFISSDSSMNVDHSLVYEKLLEETLLNNTSLLIAARNKTVSEYDYKITASRYYPYLNLSSGYNYTLNSYRNGGVKSLENDGLNVGVTLGMNIFDGFNQRRNIRNSALNVQNNDLRYRQTEQGIRADLLTLYSAYANYLRLITLENQNLETATENLEIALDRYKLGNLSGLDLREVQKSLLDAKESLLSVQYQAKIAEISLRLISGQIMQYYK
jgi:adhesin transport system outer membrane protein